MPTRLRFDPKSFNMVHGQADSSSRACVSEFVSFVRRWEQYDTDADADNTDGRKKRTAAHMQFVPISNLLEEYFEIVTCNYDSDKITIQTLKTIDDTFREEMAEK